MAYLDQLMASLFPQSAGFLPIAPEFSPQDEAAQAEAARIAAAGRLQRGVKRPFGTGAMDLGGLLNTGTMGGAMGIPGLGLLEGGAPEPAGSISPEIVPPAAPAAIPDMPADGTIEGLPPATNDPESGQPVVTQNGVPVQRPAARDSATLPQNAQPAGPGPLPSQLRPQAQMPGGGFLEKLLDPRGAPTLLALAGGFAGAPSLGTGMRRAFSNAVAPAALQQKEDREQLNQKQTVKALTDQGIPFQEALAATRTPALMTALVQKYFPTKNPVVIGNDGYVLNPQTGRYEKVIEGDPKDKNPVVQEFKTPQGEIKKQWNPVTKTWDLIPGADTPVATRDQRISVNDVTKMAEEGGKAAQIAGFRSTFKNDYGGDIFEAVGDLKNVAGRVSPWASKDAKQRSEWWQNYQSYKNIVRNDQFGSALTKTEKTEFDKADINPGMQPDVIARNLKRQQDIVDASIKRKADALIQAGYSRDAVYKAYGINPGVTAGTTGTGLKWSLE